MADVEQTKKPDWDDLPALLSVQEAADILGVHPNTLRNWDKEGKLVAIRSNGRGDFRYPKDQIRAFMERRVSGRATRLSDGQGSGLAGNGNGRMKEADGATVSTKAVVAQTPGAPIATPGALVPPLGYTTGLLQAFVHGFRTSFPAANVERSERRPSGWSIGVVAIGLILLVVAATKIGVALRPVAQEIASVFPDRTVAIVEQPLAIDGGRILGVSTEADLATERIGAALAWSSLVFGLIFFLYAIRSYLMTVIVLVSSRPRKKGNGNGNGNGYGVHHSAGGNIFRNWFRFQANGHNGNGRNRNGNGYHPGSASGGNGNGKNGNGPTLPRYPFISVHLPFFNEANVANRVLIATTSFDYPNYEVVVVDDSTDETKDILAKWAAHPKVKVIHRENREGFKGGALRVALEHTNPQAEFIAVFDADFIPYPDTLQQFVKTFVLASTGGVFEGQAVETLNITTTPVAAIQGYQRHILNHTENWLTQAVRSEYAGSYVIERPAGEVLGTLKQIAGSVFMIRADLLRRYGWGTSITEDFELTLKLYREGYKVLYTPYLQAPAECVASLRRLIRQRMRWAEGHTHNVRRSFFSILTSPHLTLREKLEFLFLSPYYLQSAFFLLGTLSWIASDFLLKVQLPFWSELLGWSLVFTNLLALPLMNAVGLFLEDSPRRDYTGLFSFIFLTYALVPFQAYAAIKGLFKRQESPWFRTPKTGHITAAFFRSKFRRILRVVMPGRAPTPKPGTAATALTRFDTFRIERRPIRGLAHGLIAGMLILTLTLSIFARHVPEVLAAPDNYYFWNLQTDEDSVGLTGLVDSVWLQQNSMRPTTQSSTNVDVLISREPVIAPDPPVNYNYYFYSRLLPTGSADAAIASGEWNLQLYIQTAGTGGSVSWSANAGLCKDGTDGGTTACDDATVANEFTQLGSIANANTNFPAGNYTKVLNASVAAQNWAANNKQRIFFHIWGTAGTNDSSRFFMGIGGSAANYISNLALPTVTVPENIWLIVAIIPFLPWFIRKKFLKVERFIDPMKVA